MSEKEFNRLLRNLSFLKQKWERNLKKGKKHSASLFKGKYFWLLKRIIRLVERDLVRW